jgi:hypothetical protein
VSSVERNRGLGRSFFGSNSSGMIAFDQSVATLWSVPNDSPYVATADNGVIGNSGRTYDANGNATGQLPSPSLPIQSWTGGAYQFGPVIRLTFVPIVPRAILATW